MNLKINTACDNAAFDDGEQYEVARILRALADKLENEGMRNMPLRDINGNTVGDIEVLK
ncbi:hypothetical protein QN372_00235 [Undibacterium sp. RTI2.1]|uniref:hypothetical protein n=1 Tax=unclassified Undibacterium TaxID=2630295 RepID=UPI002B23E3F2|nr:MULTISPECIES: hypothetical protein [unclassified Undibacterium]MEB0029166.1 hypothetical protein [Undibacterium sp. RTI2.1]MEB0115474.1 hypothetical protein [Undibacterium sp. RTI2.2]